VGYSSPSTTRQTFAVNYGFTAGVSVSRSQRLRAVGAILRTKSVDAASPIAYGYGDSLAMYCSNGPIFNINNGVGGRGGRPAPRATGRGTPDDPDVPQGRPPAEIPEPPARVEPWEAPPITDEQLRNAIGLIPPNQRPRVVLRYADSRDLFVSGLLDGGDEIAQRRQSSTCRRATATCCSSRRIRSGAGKRRAAIS
jgi:hypothetical protein